MNLELRWYQQAAFDALMEFLETEEGNPCIELPTGAGKTPLIVKIINHVQTVWPGTHMVILAHTKELVQQGYDKLVKFWPEAASLAGIYSAGLKRYDTDFPVIFAGIQSVAKKAKLFAPELVLIDEAHRIPVTGEGQYRTFIKHGLMMHPDMRVIGLTATPYRLAGGPVCGRGKILTDLIYRADVGKLIEQGYLCRPVTKVAENLPDLEKVPKKGNDYDIDVLEGVVTVEALIKKSVSEFIARAQHRRKWLIFGVSKKHIDLLQAEFARQGFDLPVLHDGVADKTRDKLVAEYKAGKYRGLLNINILTEGFDDPTVDCIGLFASTMSPGKYYQQVGRGFRTDPSKVDFLVLDFADNIVEHGPVDDITPPGSGKGGVAPVKVCSQCREPVPIGVAVCPCCGFEFPPAERDTTPKHHAVPTNAPVLLADAARWVRPRDWAFREHQKPGSRPTLRVDYLAGPMPISEWLCFEHGGIPRVDAVRWWRDRGGANPPPRTVAEAIARRGELARPLEVNVVLAGKYPRVMGYRYDVP